jgi:hypothetical protein
MRGVSLEFALCLRDRNDKATLLLKAGFWVVYLL